MEKQNETATQAEHTKKKALSFESVCLIISGVISLISVGAAFHCHLQMKKMVQLMNKAVDDVAGLTIIDVEKNIVDQAIHHAADREVGRAVSRAMKAMEDSITEETQKKVHSVVTQSYGKLQKAVTDAIAKEAAKVDKNDIMAEATERAKDLIVEKFDGKLDGLLDDYNRNLDNVSKIYQSIASSMAGKAGKDNGVTLKLG